MVGPSRGSPVVPVSEPALTYLASRWERARERAHHLSWREVADFGVPPKVPHDERTGNQFPGQMKWPTKCYTLGPGGHLLRDHYVPPVR